VQEKDSDQTDQRAAALGTHQQQPETAHWAPRGLAGHMPERPAAAAPYALTCAIAGREVQLWDGARAGGARQGRCWSRMAATHEENTGLLQNRGAPR
jgi:hypothetical protein